MGKRKQILPLQKTHLHIHRKRADKEQRTHKDEILTNLNIRKKKTQGNKNEGNISVCVCNDIVHKENKHQES